MTTETQARQVNRAKSKEYRLRNKGFLTAHSFHHSHTYMAQTHITCHCTYKFFFKSEFIKMLKGKVSIPSHTTYEVINNHFI